MSIDKNHISWAVGLIASALVGFVFAEDRWNQAQEIASAREAGNSNSYFIYGSIVRDLEDRANDLDVKANKTPSEKKKLLELRQEIALIQAAKQDLLKK